VPAASTFPAATTASSSHMLSTSSITCDDITTVPPLDTKPRRIRRMPSPDTGSTASNGSSSTSSRGAWISAQANPIFLVMPAE